MLGLSSELWASLVLDKEWYQSRSPTTVSKEAAYFGFSQDFFFFFLKTITLFCLFFCKVRKIKRCIHLRSSNQFPQSLQWLATAGFTVLRLDSNSAMKSIKHRRGDYYIRKISCYLISTDQKKSDAQKYKWNMLSFARLVNFFSCFFGQNLISYGYL